MEAFENLSASPRLPEPGLDACSRAIRYVTERPSPAVISIATGEGRGGGGVNIGCHGTTAAAVTDSRAERGKSEREGDVIAGLGGSPRAAPAASSGVWRVR